MNQQERATAPCSFLVLLCLSFLPSLINGQVPSPRLIRDDLPPGVVGSIDSLRQFRFEQQSAKTALNEPDSSLGGDELWWGGFIPGGGYEGYKDGTDNEASGIVSFRDRLILTGNFAYYEGIQSRGLASWDGDQWSEFPPPSTDYHVNSFLEFNDTLFAGGRAGDSVGALHAWDGSSWSSVSTGLLEEPGYDIQRLLAWNDTLVAVVIRPSEDRRTRYNVLVRRDDDWVSIGPDTLYDDHNYPFLFSAAVYQDELYIAGSFSEAAGDTIGNIYRWDGASWDFVGGGTNGRISDLSVFQGRLIAAGLFTWAGDVEANRIAAWDGESWHPLGLGVRRLGRPWIKKLQATEDRLYVGGEFDTAGTVAAYELAAWDGQEWSSLGPTDRYDMGPIFVSSFTMHDGNLVLAGNFYRGDRTHFGNVFEWDGSEWNLLSGRGTEPAGRVRALVATSDSLIAAGEFTVPGEWNAVTGVARWDGFSWAMIGGPFEGRISDLALYRGQIVAGGYFSSLADTSVKYIAAWDGMRWKSLGIGLGDEVTVLEVYKDRLIAGGWFNFLGDQTTRMRRISQWDGTSWSEMDYGASGLMRALTIYEGDLIAGGFFTEIGFQAIDRMARWDGETWKPFDGDITYRYDLSAVFDLEVWNGELYANGEFETIDGEPADDIAIWSGNSWRPFPEPGAGWIDAFGTYGGRLLVGGNFRFGGPVSQSYSYQWDGNEWLRMGSGAGSGSSGFSESPSASAFATWNGSLFIGGASRYAGGKPSFRIARWDGASVAQASPSITIFPSPNPVADQLKISWLMYEPGFAHLRVFNISGRQVFDESLGYRYGGNQTWTWNMSNNSSIRVAPGVYFIQLESESSMATRKVVIVR